MNITKLLTEYFCSQKEQAFVTIPAVGYLSVKLYAGLTGRDSQTGATVRVPAKRVIVFSQIKEGADVSNDHFVQWMTSNQGVDASAVLLELDHLGSVVTEDLKKSRRAMLPDIGLILVKNRPPRAGRNPATGEYRQIPGRTALILKKQWSLSEALNPEIIKAPLSFHTLPTTPGFIPSGLSTFNLGGFPNPAALWKLCQSLAVLTICRNNTRRHLVVQSLEPGIDFVSMWNGLGDDCQIFFIGGSALIRGFAHEAPMASLYNQMEPWPGTLEGIPDPLREALFHDYLDAEDMSFCVWHLQNAGGWEKGKITNFPAVPSEDPDGSGLILENFPRTAAEWIAAESISTSKPIDIQVVEQIFQHHPLTPAMLEKLSPGSSIDMREVANVGYPIA